MGEIFFASEMGDREGMSKVLFIMGAVCALLLVILPATAHLEPNYKIYVKLNCDKTKITVKNIDSYAVTRIDVMMNKYLRDMPKSAPINATPFYNEYEGHFTGWEDRRVDISFFFDLETLGAGEKTRLYIAHQPAVKVTYAVSLFSGNDLLYEQKSIVWSVRDCD